MDKIQEICDEYMKLCGAAIDDKTKQHLYFFRSLKDIKIFIKETLNLSPDHVKLAWFIKGVFFANKYFNYQRIYNPNKTKSVFYYSLMYHTWFCKGRIPKRKCIRIKYF